MSPEAQRIAIAESVGIYLHDGDHAPSNYTFVTDLPDYLNDLNAMHEAEKTLSQKDKREYAYQLNGGYYTSGLDDTFDIVHATAAQRAEAYLRTICKWEEGSDE